MVSKLFGNRVAVSIWTALVTGLIAWGLDYLLLVPMNFTSSGFWWFAILVFIAAIIISFIFNGIYRVVSDQDECYDFADYFKGYLIPFILIAVLVVWIVVMFVTSISGWQMAHAKEYAQIATIQEETSFADEVPDASKNQDYIVYVDQKTAQKLGDRTLGTVKNPSWYEVDNEYNLVQINGDYYRISALNYSGFWASRKVRDAGGIPGFVAVNVKTQEAKVVYYNEGEQMIYSPSGMFSYDLARHIHNAYPTYMLGSSFFEVDDNNHPYWITSVKEATIGMRGGVIVKSFIITDAASGEMKEYTVDTLPEWVDHAYSVGDLMQMVGWHYELQNGYWNFSKTNKYKTTYSFKSSGGEGEAYTPFDGYNTAISKDGEIIFFTGITPDNQAETNIGFVSANPRTGEIRFYAVTGAEEGSAQIAAEGLVSNLKYSASFPVLVNVEGVETYFMVLKDQGGLVQRYAFCNVENYAKCVEAESIDEAINKYKKEIGLIAADSQNDTQAKDEHDNVEENVQTTKLKAIVTEVTEAQVGGYTYYYFAVEGSELVFMSSIQNSNMQPMKLKVGVNVTIEYYESQESGIGIVKSISFDK